jgi:hypothetical protein
MRKLSDLTGQAALRRVCANLAAIRAQYHDHGASTVGWCQRLIRIACEGPALSDYHWLKVKGAGLRVPHTASAIDAAKQMREHADELGWTQIHDLDTMPAGSYAMVYLTGSGGFGHVLIARWTGVKRVCMVNDSNGVYPMKQEQMKRIYSAWIPKA